MHRDEYHDHFVFFCHSSLTIVWPCHCDQKQQPEVQFRHTGPQGLHLCPPTKSLQPPAGVHRFELWMFTSCAQCDCSALLLFQKTECNFFFFNKFPVVWLSAYQKTSHWTVSPVIVSPNFSMAGFDLQYISLKRSQTGKKLVIMNTFPSIAVYILLGLVQNSWTFFVLCGLTKPQFPVKR